MIHGIGCSVPLHQMYLAKGRLYLQSYNKLMVKQITLAWVVKEDLRAALRIALAETLAPEKEELREGAAAPPTKGVRQAVV